VGAVKRVLLALIGLGSVSEWCAHNLECPLVIVK
jgi:nucleotide-binding universal stress UspA family protein